ncbi:hypothetical protein Scep_002739 [Stephania cephalantha]|uniref:Uncharacterized protein n=1 Tax=Stephania cephalantha TaxID=152367 RepID=A0AAP0LAI9_9MAGN
MRQRRQVQQRSANRTSKLATTQSQYLKMVKFCRGYHAQPFMNWVLSLLHILYILNAEDFSSNNFEGEIPELIGDFKSLVVLNLSYNSLEGRIPSSLGNLRDLQLLDLSNNNLSGEIPPELRNMNSDGEDAEEDTPLMRKWSEETVMANFKIVGCLRFPIE